MEKLKNVLVVAFAALVLCTGVVKAEGLSGLTGSKVPAAYDQNEPAESNLSPFYGSVSGALTWPNDNDVTVDYGNEKVESETFSLDAKSAFFVRGALGAHVGRDWRVEVEAGHGRVKHTFSDVEGTEASDSDDIVELVAVLPETTGDVVNVKSRVNTLMANVYYDFNSMKLFGNATPYLGGGLGVAFVKSDLTVNGEEIGSDSHSELAAQIMAGLNFALTERVTLRTGYRYLYIDSGKSYSDEDLGVTASSEDTHSHAIEVGLSYRF